MLTEQVGVCAADAFARLAAYAYTHDRRRADVARDIVTRRLRLAPTRPGWPILMTASHSHRLAARGPLQPQRRGDS